VATDTDSVVGRAEMMLMMSCVRRRITVVRAMLLLLLLHLDSEVDRFTLQLNASARHLRLYSRPTSRFIATQNKAIVDIRLRPPSGVASTEQIEQLLPQTPKDHFCKSCKSNKT